MTGLAIFTVVHVALSLMAIVAGFVVMAGFLRAAYSQWWNTAFLISAVTASATGFGFPIHGLLPAHIVGSSKT